MSRHPDSQNPSDSFGIKASGQIVEALVIDVKDPKKEGRVKVRILGMGQEQRAVPDQNLAWVSAIQNNQPSVRGMGFFPPNYENGSKVYLLSTGDQGWMIMGSVPNSQSDRTKSDIHEDARDPEHRSVYRNEEEFKRYAQANTTNQANTTVNDGTSNWQRDAKDHKENITEAPTTDKYGYRQSVKDPKGSFPTIGIDKFANFRNPQAFIKNLIGDKGSVIPNALDMLENLKKADPLSAPLPTNVMGISNLQGAIAGLMALLKKQQGNDEGQEELQQLLDEVGIPVRINAVAKITEDDDTLTGVSDYGGTS